MKRLFASCLVAMSGCSTGGDTPSGDGEAADGTFAFRGYTSGEVELVGTDGSTGSFDADGVLAPTDDALMLYDGTVDLIRVPTGPIDAAAATSRAVAASEYVEIYRDGLSVYRGTEPGAPSPQRDAWWIGFDGTDVALATTAAEELFFLRLDDAFLMTRSGTDLVGASIDPAAQWTVVDDVRAYPQLVTEGGRVVYLAESTNGGFAISVRSVEIGGANDVLLSDAAPYHDVHGAVGDRVIIGVDPLSFGATELVAVDANGGPPVTIAAPAPSGSTPEEYRTLDVSRCFLGTAGANERVLAMGDRLLHLRLVAVPPASPGWELLAAPLTGGPATSLGLVDINGGRCAAGDTLLMYREPGSPMVRVDVDTGNEVTIIPVPFLELALVGDRLAYQEQGNGYRHFATSAMDGSDVVELLPEAGIYSQFFGAYEGAVLMLDCDETGNICDLYRVDVDTGAGDLLAAGVLYGTVSRQDGWMVHLVSGADETGIDSRWHAVALDGSGSRDITPAGELQYHEFLGFFR